MLQDRKERGKLKIEESKDGKKVYKKDDHQERRNVNTIKCISIDTHQLHVSRRITTSKNASQL